MILADIPHHLIDPPAIVAPEEVRKRRRRGATNWDRPDRTPGTRSRRGPSLGTALVIGMIVFGDDGQPCRIVHINPDGVTGYCVPVEQ